MKLETTRLPPVTMRTKERFILPALLAVSTATAGSTALPADLLAQAQQRGGMGMMGAFRSEGQRLWTLLDQRFDEFSETVALTEVQSGLVEIVVEDFRQTNEDALERLAAMITEMRGLMGGGRPDRGAVTQIAEKHGNPVQLLAPAFQSMKADIADLLEPEQVDAMNRLLLAQRPRRPPPSH